MRSRRLPAVILTLLLFHPASARAFATIEHPTTVDGLAASSRWSAAPHPEAGGAGLHDGIQVAVEPGFADKIALRVAGAVTPEDVTDIQTAVMAAFALWESPVLRFDLAFDGPAVRGERAGPEIDVFAVPNGDPALASAPSETFGLTAQVSVYVADRRLTNGMVSSGEAIAGVDIFVNVDALAQAIDLGPRIFGRPFTRSEQLAALTRLLGHEIGHGIGLGHPHQYDSSTNFDRDTNPLNPILVDPAAPLAGLALSKAIDPNAIMSSRPTLLPGALLFTALRNDDRGGRDVLYPTADGERRCGEGVLPPDQECDDGDACNGVERCDREAGRCVASPALACDDGDFCNGQERCERSRCVQGTNPCIDENPCTMDTCDPSGSCAHIPDVARCSVQPVPARKLTIGLGRKRTGSGRLVFVTPGRLAPPKPGTEPTLGGATLRVLDATGAELELVLPSSGWKPLGGRRASRGFRYAHSGGGDPCKMVISAGSGLRAACRVDAMTVPSPLVPPVQVIVQTGPPVVGTTSYCAVLNGGVRRGSFVATSAPAPASCPSALD